MATDKPQKQPPETPQLVSVEELKDRHNTPDAVFVGMAAAKGWKPGKQASENDYIQAVKEFLDGPISGKKVKTDA